MSHNIRGIIIKKESFRNSQISKVVDGQDDFLTISKYAELDQNLLLFPFGNVYQFKKEGYVTPEEVYNQGYDLLCIELSLEYGDCIYVETNYFGGIGEQTAYYYNNGTLIWSQDDSHGCINECLSRIDIKRVIKNGWDCDEFDSVGLGRFRSNDSIIKWYDENKK